MLYDCKKHSINFNEKKSCMYALIIHVVVVIICIINLLI